MVCQKCQKWKIMDIFAILRQFFLFKIIIVKHRKVVNAAERRTRDHDKWGMLPVYPYLFRAGGAAARLHAGVMRRFHPAGGAGTAAPGAGRQSAQQHGTCSGRQLWPDNAAAALPVRKRRGAGAVAGGAGGCAPALPAAGYIKKRNEYGRRTGFLWYLSVLRAQTSAILRN